MKYPGKRIAIGFISIALASCASIQQVENKGRGNEEPMSSHKISITRKIFMPHKPEVVFNFVTAEDVLPKVLTGYGPLPAVVKTSDNTGPWTVPGSARRVHLADKSVLREQLTHYEPAKYFAYRVFDFGNPLLRTLATEGKGEWTFTKGPEGTLVAWTYTFTAKNALTAIPMSGITQILWRGYMNVCLENTATLLGRRE
jgi:Polyketide cyclase / dehydrase and lipid transport